MCVLTQAVQPADTCQHDTFVAHAPSAPCLRCLQIIAQTARFVRSSGANGIQVEVKLRVQQAGNPKFDFLHTQDRLYPYYRWVVAQP